QNCQICRPRAVLLRRPRRAGPASNPATKPSNSPTSKRSSNQTGGKFSKPSTTETKNLNARRKKPSTSTPSPAPVSLSAQKPGVQPCCQGNRKNLLLRKLL